jgi:iron complex transport system substrate-binding protein
MRIVSLISSATEIACELGLAPQLVGISHECDYPPSIKGLPIVSESRINPLRPSKEIHESVQSLIEGSLSLYKVKLDVLEVLKPDLILTQNQCEVCAVSVKDVEEALKQITKKDTKVCVLNAFALDDICADFRKVGEATGRQKEAEELVTRFWIRLNQVNAKAGTHLIHRPKVLALEWIDPPMVAGSWIPELVTLSGADPLLVDGPKPFKKVSWEELYTLTPETIVIFPCGWSFERTLQELNREEIRARFSSWPGIKDIPVFACDGNQFFNRPGPRIADSLELLASVIWPEKFGTKGYGFTFGRWDYQK